MTTSHRLSSDPSGRTRRRYTGQRCSDLARMMRAHRKDGYIRVVQQKTGVELWILELQALAAELALSNDHRSLLTTSNGAAFSADALGHWFADAIEAAGLPEDCVLLGLRKTAALRPAAAFTRSCQSPGTSRSPRRSATPGRRARKSSSWNRTQTELTMANAPLWQVANRYQVVDSQMVTDPAPLTSCYPEVEALGSVRSSTSIGGST